MRTLLTILAGVAVLVFVMLMPKIEGVLPKEEVTTSKPEEAIEEDTLVYSRSEALKGLTVVIDPGHGGTDIGTSRLVNKVRACEDEYTYAVACLLKKMVESAGGEAWVTIKDRSSGFNLVKTDASGIFPLDTDEYFTLGGEQVTSGVKGLSQRLRYGNMLFEESSSGNTVFLSLHFDASSPSLEGVTLYTPRGASPAIVSCLEDSFREANRLRRKDGKPGEYYPVVQSGNKENGVRNLYILDPKHNQIPEKVLVELGNITHPSDLWKMRQERIREEYATCLFKALCNFNR